MRVMVVVAMAGLRKSGAWRWVREERDLETNGLEQVGLLSKG